MAARPFDKTDKKEAHRTKPVCFPKKGSPLSTRPSYLVRLAGYGFLGFIHDLAINLLFTVQGGLAILYFRLVGGGGR